jgi:hypothetical protein
MQTARNLLMRLRPEPTFQVLDESEHVTRKRAYKKFKKAKDKTDKQIYYTIFPFIALLLFVLIRKAMYVIDMT